MTSSAPIALLLAASLAPLVAACGECDRPICADDVPATGPGEDVEQRFTLGNSDFVEAWISMAAESELTMDFEAFGGDLSWDIHSHEGESVTIHASGIDASREVDFVAPMAGDFFITFENESPSDVAVTARIQIADGDQFVRWL